MQEFISEDDLDTFEGWLRYQAIDAATLMPGELAASSPQAVRSPDLRSPVFCKNRAAAVLFADYCFWKSIQFRCNWLSPSPMSAKMLVADAAV